MELVKRILSAVVFLPLFVLLVARGPRWAFALLVLVVCAVGQWEFYRLVSTTRLEGNRSLALLVGIGLLMGFYAPWPWLLPLFLSLGIAGFLASALSSAGHSALPAQPGPGNAAALGLFGALYVNWLLGHALWLRALPHGVEWVFLLVFVTWGGDASAYLVGATLGRHRLSALSPKKTVEGALGGFAGAVTAALLARVLFYHDLPVPHAAAIGALLGIVGLLGDLSESAMKRTVGVKDTGNLIPGHGGVLDRIDSLLFTTPALYYYARLAMGG